jgi:predicted PurR-regulated permease PerM
MGLVAAILLGVGYALLGLPYPAALALLALMGWLIPLVGFAVILIPVFLSALQLGGGIVFLASAFTLLVLMGLKFWIEPKYLHPRRYSNFLQVFWIVVLGSFMGLGGFLAGPVVAAATQAIREQYLQYRLRPEQVEIQMAALRQRYKDAYTRYAEINEGQPSPELGSFFNRLESTLQSAEQLAENHYKGD